MARLIALLLVVAAPRIQAETLPARIETTFQAARYLKAADGKVMIDGKWELASPRH